MFGHQDENEQNNQTPAEPQADAALVAGSPTPAVDPVDTNEVDEALKALSAHATPDQPAADAPADPVVVPAPASEVASAPAVDTFDTSRAVADPGRSDETPTDPDTAKLLDIKQDALQQLTPLIDQLEQTPEEKFRTTMMMIQAADNQALLSAAYESAQQITDEKVKAQALLDIVNEINYFTQQAEA